MRREQLVEKIAYKMKVTKKDADTYLTAFLDSIMDMLAKNGHVVDKDSGILKLMNTKPGKQKIH